MKSYDIQNLKTKKWSVIEVKDNEGPQKAVESLIGRKVTKVRDNDNALYYVYETGTQTDRYKTQTGHYGPVSLYCDRTDACENTEEEDREI